MRDMERLDLPSASSFEIDVACPGNRNLRKLLPPEPEDKKEEVDEITLTGTLIHRARETGDTSELDADALATYNAGLDYEKRLVASWCQDHSINDYREGPREERLWLHDQQTGERILSAKLDVQYLQQPRAYKLLCVDWKTGWSWHLTPSQRNWQLRVQAVLAWREYDGIQSVRVGFVKPIATSDRLDFTDYNIDDLRRSEEMIRAKLWEVGQPFAERRAGPHCNYCPCKGELCPESMAYALIPTVVARASNIPELDKYQAASLVDRLTMEDVKALHLRAGIIVKILDAAKAKLKRLDDETLKSLGLVRKPGRKMFTITNVKEAFEFLKSFPIAEEEIWKAMGFSNGELVDALRRDQGWEKAKAEGFVKGRLYPFAETKQAEGSIGVL